MRSRPRKPACPSLVWNTSGAGWPVSRQYVRTARTPPMPEQHLLEQPVLAAAAVEPVGDLAFAEVVLLDVRVEHQQRYPADLGQPDPCACSDRPPGRARETWAGVPSASRSRLTGSSLGSRTRIVLLLPAVAGQGLAEVAVPVEQPDADQRYAEVAGGLEMVAGEDAEAAGVLGQGGGDAELGREVGDGGGNSALGSPVPLCAWYHRVAGAGSRRRSSATAASRRRKRRSSASSASRAADTAPSSRTGSPPAAASARGRRTGRVHGSRHARTSADCAPGR